MFWLVACARRIQASSLHLVVVLYGADGLKKFRLRAPEERVILFCSELFYYTWSLSLPISFAAKLSTNSRHGKWVSRTLVLPSMDVKAMNQLFCFLVSTRRAEINMYVAGLISRWQYASTGIIKKFFERFFGKNDKNIKRGSEFTSKLTDLCKDHSKTVTSGTYCDIFYHRHFWIWNLNFSGFIMRILNFYEAVDNSYWGRRAHYASQMNLWCIIW